jgi:hypothetical protein
MVVQLLDESLQVPHFQCYLRMACQGLVFAHT